MRRIASRQNPVVSRYRAAARGEADGLVLLDGVHLVIEALAARVVLQEAAVAAEYANDAAGREMIERLERAGVAVVFATAPVMSALSPVRSTSPVVALARRPSDDDVFAGTPPCVVVAVDIQDPGNLGAILRVAEAAGATGAIVAGVSADPFGWKALRGSMGSALRLPVRWDKRAVDAVVRDARGAGCRIVASAPRGGRSLFEANVTAPVAILIGGEGSGLPAAVVDAADERVTIPMQAPVESLNAAVTAALVLYEARRPRR